MSGASAVWAESGALEVSAVSVVLEASAVLEGSAVPEVSAASAARAVWASLEALVVQEGSAILEESAVLVESRVQKAVPAAGFRTGSTAHNIEEAPHTQIARPRTDLAAMLGVLRSHRARPVRGSRSAVRAGTCRAAVPAQAEPVIVGAPEAGPAPARGLLAVDRIASAVATYPAADRAEAEVATPSHHRAGTMDRVRVPRVAAAHRAPAPGGAAAAGAAAVAEDADGQRQPRMMGALA